ncbi:protein POLLENLESS 3-like [Primulina huaijiensis]|uniref:protein POLLENLESS 3-like n=1 Tax=Primulina huaijiensis TaxID=1492673 RepID=UPI003CC76686
MPTNSSVDQYTSYYSSQPRGFLTPPPTWKTRRSSPVLPGSEKKPRRSPQGKSDLFHVFHKVPSGDSPYGRAKHVQLVDKDPSRAVSMFWAAINSGDRVDSALKDMAVVMKQLDRSDEAVEAIKSFRHLCPLESQESLDNILVELYKKSGRIEEEIEMLKLKLKQIEDGTAFGGQRTKMARSQGKKFQITVEKDYSRVLGNLAWAYMQLKDYKSAEELYRKALSIEPDKNKQCNLAMCLMRMNKLTEAKFLLQATGISFDSGPMDESFAKSYERASQMLVELEAKGVLEPVKQTDICLSFKNMNLGAFTEFPYEKRSYFDRKTNHGWYNVSREEADCSLRPVYGSPFYNGKIPKVPFTQPRRCSLSSNNGNQRNAKANGAFCRKLSFFEKSAETETETETELALTYNEEKLKNFQPKPDTKEIHDECLKEVENSTPDEILKVCEKSPENLKSERKKSWADMVEEEEQASESWKIDFPNKYSGNHFAESLSSYRTPGKMFAVSVNKGLNDENVNSNVIPRTPPISMEGSIEHGRENFMQPEKLLRPSLCYFDQHQNPFTAKIRSASPLPLKSLHFEGKGLVSSDDLFSTTSINRRNRLQVFQDITHVPVSP